MRVFDLPLRIFHWMFVSFFLAAFFIAKNVSDENIVFYYHMIFGIMVFLLVLWRIIWGFIGTKYSRFCSFEMHPKKLFVYLKGIFKHQNDSSIGHNPASSWATLIFLIFGFFLFVTGILMTNTPYKEEVEDFHELFANGFMIMAILHILGVLWHTFKIKDSLVFSMFNGIKIVNQKELVVIERKSVPAFILCTVIFFSVIFLFYNLNSGEKYIEMSLFQLRLGELQDKLIFCFKDESKIFIISLRVCESCCGFFNNFSFKYGIYSIGYFFTWA